MHTVAWSDTQADSTPEVSLPQACCWKTLGSASCREASWVWANLLKQLARPCKCSVVHAVSTISAEQGVCRDTQMLCAEQRWGVEAAACRVKPTGALQKRLPCS